MANRLEMAEVNAIETLYQSGHSRRQIAELLNVHRETVGKYVARLQNRPNAPTGLEGSLGTVEPTTTGPPSECEPYREVIVAKLGLTTHHATYLERPGRPIAAPRASQVSRSAAQLEAPDR